MFIIAIFSIFFTYHLSEKESLERFKQLEPAILNVSHEIDVSNPKEQWLFIHVKNIAQFKSTGNITLYRIEVDPHKPHMILPSLEPNENRTIELRINYTQVNYSIKSENIGFGVTCEIPTSKLYFIHEKESISYKLTCDNCKTEGIIRRIPSLEAIETTLVFKPETRSCEGKFPTYSWVQYRLEDLPK